MKEFIDYIEQKTPLNEEDINLLEKVFKPIRLPAKSIFIEEGRTERFLYFLAEGIVKGYKFSSGKVVVEHLVEKNNFLTAMPGFFEETPSSDSFETITACMLFRISKTDFDLLKQSANKWNELIDDVKNENLRCKMERVNDFQTLSAKERYLKFVKQSPELALNVSIENIASFLGIEPQSLSRIRGQLTI